MLSCRQLLQRTPTIVVSVRAINTPSCINKTWLEETVEETVVVVSKATTTAQEVEEEAVEEGAEVGVGEARRTMMTLITLYSNGPVVCPARHTY